MPIALKKRTIGLKLEGTPGTAETLAQADYNFKAFNITFKTDIEMIERPYATGGFGEFTDLVGKKLGAVSFSFHLAEATTSGDAPNWGKILKIGGFKETDNGTNITYDLDDTKNFVTATIEVVDYDEGSSPVQKLYRFKGCMAKIKAVCDGVGQPVRFDVEAMGAYLGCTDRAFASVLTPDALETSMAPSFLNGTATYNSNALKMDKWTMDFGQELALEVDPAEATGVKGYHMAGYKPRFTADPLSKLEATDGLEAAYQSGTAAALSMTLGSTITFAATRMQITKVDVADRGGLVVKNIEGKILRSVADGDDETGFPVTITVA